MKHFNPTNTTKLFHYVSNATTTTTRTRNNQFKTKFLESTYYNPIRENKYNIRYKMKSTGQSSSEHLLTKTQLQERVLSLHTGTIIGLTGKSRHGKSTVADYLAIKYNFKEISFAGPLKSAASELFGIPLCDFYDEKKKNTPHEMYNVSPRQILQQLGTEFVRDKVDVNHLVDLAFWKLQEIIEENPEQNVVFSDVRFDNETSIIKHKKNSHVWMIDATTRLACENKDVTDKENTGAGLGHSSEMGISSSLIDTTIFNNLETQDLYHTIDGIFRDLEVKHS